MLMLADKEFPTTGVLCAWCLEECETPYGEADRAWQHAADLGWIVVTDDGGEQLHYCPGCGTRKR
jgi:hypothetical protein